MAHNIMRVDSINDRYVTETMIDLNLDLNEEIDFDFFDNVDTPCKPPLVKDHDKNDTVNDLPPRSCSPQHLEEEDDDDVQINPHLSCRDLSCKAFSSTGIDKNINSSSDSIEEPLSTGTETEDKYIDNFEEYESSKNTENTSSKEAENKSGDKDLNSQTSVINENTTHSFLPSEKSSYEDTFCSNPNESDVSCQSDGEDPKISKFNNDDKEDVSSRKSSFSEASSEHFNKDALRKSILNLNEVIPAQSIENPNDDALSKSSKSQRAEGSGSGYDSDEGCAFEGSDSDELLLGVHTLTIIPRESEEESISRPKICEQSDSSQEIQMIHSTSCEKAAITARSSSGYSSASCKAHGCMVSRSNTSKAEGRQHSQMKARSPDMDEFIKSFRKIQPSPTVSFSSTEKYSSKKRSRRNMSFSNDELQRIERENAILLNKIVLQQRTRPTVVHKYERRVTSNAINRARQLKKIENDNEILLRKIQDVKRKSTLSAHNSRCISQASASTSQF